MCNIIHIQYSDNLKVLMIFRMWRNVQARLGVIKPHKYHPCFNIKAEKECKGLVFFMHGLGDMGMGWAEGFAYHAHPNVRYIFPSANQMPVTLNMGMKMPSWFDIKDLSDQLDERYDIGTYFLPLVNYI